MSSLICASFGMHLLSRPRLGSSFRHHNNLRTTSSAIIAAGRVSSSIASPELSSHGTIHHFGPRYSHLLKLNTSSSLFSSLIVSNGMATKKSGPSLMGKMEEEKPLRHLLRDAVRDYGSVIMVMHVVFSLISLGTIYAFIKFGFDITPYINRAIDIHQKGETFGNVSPTMVKYFGTGSEFLIAYAIHKIIMPFRICVTLGLAPVFVTMYRTKTLNFFKAFKMVTTKKSRIRID